MDRKEVGVKTNHIERDSAQILHQKEAIMSGWTSEELSNILTDFAEVHDGRLGHDFDYAVAPDDKGSIHVTFPHDIPATQFSFLVNYLQYPKNYDLKTHSISVMGKALITPDFHSAGKSLLGQNATFYIPSDARDFDLVYVRVGDETLENSFASRRWKKVTDSRIPAGVEIK
jgi:hypothetical protein